MKKIFYTVLALAISISLNAQTVPGYIFTSWSGTGATNSAVFYAKDNKIQAIYYPSDFPTMPKGTITSVWLRYAPNGASLDSVTLSNFKVSLGLTADSEYNPSGYNNFLTGLTKIYERTTASFTGIKTMGKWVNFPVDANFFYDRTQNLAVEVLHGYEVSNNYGGFSWMASTNTAPKRRELHGSKDSVRSLNGAQAIILDIGFDIAPVAGIGSANNIRSIGLFPNPSTDGRFMISLKSQKTMKKLTVTITDVTGKAVLRKQYNGGNSKEFAHEVDASSLPKGAYFVQIDADKDRVVSTITIQ